MAMVTKTIKLGVHKEVHAIKRNAIVETQVLYNRVIAFYMDFFVAHRGVFKEHVSYTKKNGEPAERHWTNQELLTLAERHTLSTPAHPHPLMPLEAIPQAKGMPTGLRRAAINHAAGKVKGWFVLLNQWEQNGKKGREPRLGEPNEPVTFYADMVDYPDFDLLPQATVQQTFIAVKLWYEGEWQKVPLPITLPLRDSEALRAAQAESQRIRTETAQIKARKAPNEPWTDEERAALRPKVWVARSLSLYAQRDKRYPGNLRFALHVPLEKYVQTPKKAKEQLQKNPGLPVVTVDLGVNRLAVMGAFRLDQLLATQFIHGSALNHKRHLLLNAISKKRAQSGRLPKNVHDNVHLWQKVRHLDENAARQVARRIVDFACQHGAQVIVFEYLRKYRAPQEKMSRSGRKNHKRAYWLRGQIVQWVRDLAFREGILTVERNPAYTSQMCPHCPANYRQVGSRQRHTFTCSNPDHVYRADADFVGIINLYRKWSGTFTYPSRKKDEPKPA
ncbi:zinc ribbon domain-containing protein [Sulfobacillus thermosulfidooxidans]|uniref:zinc ribbon domain-containing protein n=1 Tax=Sulfobacillus thermosulfidooxidans TaxID=28034 RepID=UPI0006B5E66F|nr:zinc ribbon domain-containing protein [Sulfobacillus thermosulfidooxidans]